MEKMSFVLEIMAFEFGIKVCKLQREYFLSGVNDLKNSLKITNQTNKDFFPNSIFPKFMEK